MRVQHGGQEQRMAAGHHVEGGQGEKILLGFAGAVHHLYKACQCVEEVVLSVAIPGEEECI